MNTMEKILRKKFALDKKYSPKKVHCDERLQSGNKIVKIGNDVPKGTEYEVFNLNATPEAFTFSVAFSVEGKTSKYIKHFKYSTKEEAMSDGWEF